MQRDNRRSSLERPGPRSDCTSVANLPKSREGWPNAMDPCFNPTRPVFESVLDGEPAETATTISCTHDEEQAVVRKLDQMYHSAVSLLSTLEWYLPSHCEHFHPHRLRVPLKDASEIFAKLGN